MTQPDENGFVKRGFYLLGGMAALAAVVLFILLYRPEPRAQPFSLPKLPPKASEPGWRIRYNATVALLRRGSDALPWDVVLEMLDEPQQLKNCEITRPDGSVVPISDHTSVDIGVAEVGGSYSLALGLKSTLHTTLGDIDATLPYNITIDT